MPADDNWRDGFGRWSDEHAHRVRLARHRQKAKSKRRMQRDPSLADALDGLQTAERYCEQQGHEELAREIAGVYQQLGRDADWPE